VTFEPPTNVAVHVVGQSIPAGTLVTLPSPVGIWMLIVTSAGGGGSSDVAGRPHAGETAMAPSRKSSAIRLVIGYRTRREDAIFRAEFAAHLNGC
jgi:hypothetical protein